MEINKETIQMIVAIIQIIGVPLFLWVIRKIGQIHKGNKYQSMQIEAFVEATSKQFGNGEFRDHYHALLKDKMEKYNFIYKG
jgi:hypothetical protein